MQRWDLVSMVINGIIGAGIFGVPSKVFALSGAYSLLAFVICAICASLIVFSFAEVASRYSNAGGPYLYAYDTFGPLTGFTVGWLVWIARLTSFSANCSLLPEYLSIFFPGVSTGWARAIVVTVVVLLLTTVNLVGVRKVANTSNTTAAGKLLPLAIFIGAGLFFLNPSNFDFVWPGYRPFSQSVLLLVYAFTGFEMAVIPASEIKEPRRDLPSALIKGIMVVVTFYILIQIVAIGTLPGLASTQRPLADAAKQFLGTGGALMIIIGILISLAGNLNIIMLSGSRMLFAMAEGGAIPKKLAEVHAHYRTPFWAVLLTAGAMLAFTLSGKFVYLATISTISRLVTYMVTCGALPVLRRRPNAPPANFLVPGGVVIATLGLLLGVWLLSNATLREARDTTIAAGIGLVVYGVYRRFAR